MAPGKSGVHAHGEGERVIALERPVSGIQNWWSVGCRGSNPLGCSVSPLDHPGGGGCPPPWSHISTWKVRSTLRMGETPLGAWKDFTVNVLFANMLNQILQTFQHCPFVGFFKLSEIGPLRPCGLCFWGSCAPALLYQRSRTSGEGPAKHHPRSEEQHV